MPRRLAPWIGPAAATLLVLACESFDAASPGPVDETSDAAAAEAASEAMAVPPDGATSDGAAIDAGACAKRLVEERQSFSTAPLPAAWTKNEQNGTVDIAAVPIADGGPASALHSVVKVPDGGSAWAFARTKLAVQPRWVDVSYRVLVPSSGFYAELGCDVAVADKNATEFTGTIFGLQRFTSGPFYFGWNARGADAGAKDRTPLGLDVEAPARWYGVRLRIDISADSADASMTLTDTSTGSEKTVSAPGVPVAGARDEVMVDCGLVYVGQASGNTELPVADVSITACPE